MKRTCRRLRWSVPATAILMLAATAEAQEASDHSIGHTQEPMEKPATAESLASPTAATNGETQLPAVSVGKDWPAPVEDTKRFGSLRIDQLELRLGNDTDKLGWDAVGWYGGDYSRFWWKTEGDWETSGTQNGQVEIQGLYGRLIARYWDLQLGLRYDYVSGPGVDRSRTFAVIGLQGLAPYRFELEPALFISQDGDLSGRLTASYDLLLTQRLILQPRAELDAALQSVDKFGVGEGINSLDLGMRLRYEVTREFAPYMGIQWSRKFGETAAIARSDGESTEDVEFLFGLSIRF